jgi:hypothetical protein
LAPLVSSFSLVFDFFRFWRRFSSPDDALEDDEDDERRLFGFFFFRFFTFRSREELDDEELKSLLNDTILI